MNQPINLLFDENFGRPIVRVLAQAFLLQKETITAKHLSELATPGTEDDIWIPQIASGDWIVVSGDRAKRCGGAKLPNVCVQHKVSHVLLSSTLHNSPSFEKLRAILYVWPCLCAIMTRPRGLRFDLKCSQSGSYHLMEYSSPTEVLT